MFRLLFVALEATFTFYFWALYSKDKDYKMGACTPWPRDSFTYHGLCNHSALNERVNGNFDLTADQLTSLAALVKERSRQRAREQYEETFTFYFWALYSKDKDYKMGFCTPWFRISFTYRGLCTHSSLNERVVDKYFTQSQYHV